ncbi:Protein argonaute 4B [Ranunculus cassubicifolius]
MEPKAEEAEILPPPPPLKADVIPKSVRFPMARAGVGRRGQPVQLLTNHFKVNFGGVDGDFYQYSVSLSYEDDRPVEGKGVGRKVLDKLQQTYESELGGKDFAYDGEKTLFTVGPLPGNKLEFAVVLEEMTSNRTGGNGSPGGSGSPNESDRKRIRRPYNSKSFKVAISFATKIPMRSIAMALRGQESEHFQESVRVLDIILRQHAAKQGCLLVRQSFFHNNPRNFCDLTGGVMGCRGFHTSFRATQGGLSLNMDVSTTMIVKPGSVIKFLEDNQGVSNAHNIDWAKAKRTLKNLRISVSPQNREFKITGLSDQPCNNQLFSMKQRNDTNGEGEPVEMTVYDYFRNQKSIDLQYADFPCINVGRPKKPTYFPVELCSLVSLQRYTKSLSGQQRSKLVDASRQKPQERMATLSEALSANNYKQDKLLQAAGVSIQGNFTQIQGRILAAPKLIVGNGENLVPRFGKWNFRGKKMVEPAKIQKWVIVNFSIQKCDVQKLSNDFCRMARQMAMIVESPFMIINEENQYRRAAPPVRVEKMLDQIKSKLPGPPLYILCLFPERNSILYGPWKKRTLADFGIVTQCFAPQQRCNDQVLANVLLKTNAKLGGLNSLLAVERPCSIPLISKLPTIILGMDVSHGSPGQSDIPSVAALVSSRQWPLISRYRASVRTQSPKVEMIDALYKRVSDTVDEGLVRELMLDFYTSSGKRKPDQVIIFRDGVSESQFNQVLNIELEQIIEACKFLDDKWSPKFTVIVAQKNHHTKFFQTNSPDNVPPGTVVDDHICHPRQNDFYMCSHNGAIGTSRPAHYHVLYDQVGFSADDLQELVHSLSYVYQRSSTAISIVAPVYYAHLAAAQVGKFMKFDEMSETSSSHAGVTSGGPVSVPELPRLHENVSSSMFFC